MNSQQKLTKRQTILIVSIAIIVGILGMIIFLILDLRAGTSEMKQIFPDVQRESRNYFLPVKPKNHPAPNDTKSWNNQRLMMTKDYPSNLKRAYCYQSQNENNHFFEVTKWMWNSHVSHHDYANGLRGYWVIDQQHQIYPSATQSKKMPLWTSEPDISESNNGQLIFDSVKGNAMAVKKDYYKNIGG